MDEEFEQEASVSNPSIPSVEVGGQTSKSYTFHSSSKNETPEPENEEWIMGIDEAGRGPVLGPMVYAVAYCRAEFEDELKEMGFADSKTLKADRRSELSNVLCSQPDKLKWAVRVLSATDISAGMLQKFPYNLNAQAHDTTAALIREVLSMGFRITKCFVDTVGPSDAYQRKLTGYFPSIEFTVTSKADSKFAIVSAASIAAKVTRDTIIENWKYDESGSHLTELGSGYPSDPNTVSYLSQSLDPLFGFTNVARFSWQTVRTLLEKKGLKVRWADEPPTIQKYFDPSAAPKKISPVGLWKETCLSSVSSL
ncbi:ribonuclease HII [Atractiella rhizophila]|nr:ribonuclease HII [Atractiella rhizophila]